MRFFKCSGKYLHAVKKAQNIKNPKPHRFFFPCLPLPSFPSHKKKKHLSFSMLPCSCRKWKKPHCLNKAYMWYITVQRYYYSYIWTSCRVTLLQNFFAVLSVFKEIESLWFTHLRTSPEAFSWTLTKLNLQRKSKWYFVKESENYSLPGSLDTIHRGLFCKVTTGKCTF